MDWSVEAVLVLTGLRAILLASNATIGALALAAGFGFLLVVAEMGKLRES